MKKKSILDVLVVIIIVLSYFSVTIYKYSSIANALLAIMVFSISILWMLKYDEPIKLSRFLLMCISISLIVITRQFNLVSLLVLALICTIADNNCINIKTYLKISIICFIATLLCYIILGLNKSADTHIWRVTTQSIVSRLSLGFEHPNQAMFKWFGLALGILTLCNKRNVYSITFIIFIVSMGIYKYTASRTTMISLIIVIGLQILFRRKLDKDLKSGIKKIIALTPLIYTLVSYASTSLYKFEYINNLFSGRFALYREYVDLVGFTWFGNSFIESNAMLDNSYLHMFLSKGFIFSAAYIVFIYILISNTKKLTLCDAIILFSYFTSALAETILFKFDLIILVVIVLYRHKNTIVEVDGEYDTANTKENTLLLDWRQSEAR